MQDSVNDLSPGGLSDSPSELGYTQRRLRTWGQGLRRPVEEPVEARTSSQYSEAKSNQKAPTLTTPTRKPTAEQVLMVILVSRPRSGEKRNTPIRIRPSEADVRHIHPAR